MLVRQTLYNADWKRINSTADKLFIFHKRERKPGWAIQTSSANSRVFPSSAQGGVKLDSAAPLLHWNRGSRHLHAGFMQKHDHDNHYGLRHERNRGEP